MPAYRRLLVTDFDGTITERDFYELAISKVSREGGPDYWEDYAAGRISHFEAMRGIYSRIRCSEEDADRLIREMDPDPQLAGGIGRLRNAGWDVVVVSAGSHWYIDPLLAEQRVTVTVHANPGRFSVNEGLVLEPPRDSPHYCPDHGISKESVIREALGNYERVAFAGNGPPDLGAALLVEPELRFARGWLAAELARRGIPFVVYRRWSEIADRLAGP